MESQEENLRIARALNDQIMLMESFSKVSNLCFERCIKSAKASLNYTEESCLTNCVDRHYDTQFFMLSRLNEKAEREASKLS